MVMVQDVKRYKSRNERRYTDEVGRTVEAPEEAAVHEQITELSTINRVFTDNFSIYHSFPSFRSSSKCINPNKLTIYSRQQRILCTNSTNTDKSSESQPH